jgi:diguanylate cyclase (GGDEF)-like protein/PAS domain S-box-containing protein
MQTKFSLIGNMRLAARAARSSLGQLIAAVADRVSLSGYAAPARATHRSLLESEERFRLLVEGVHDYAIVMLDPNGKVVSWNSGAQRIKGYSADQIIGQHFSRFFSAEDIARAKPEEELQMASRTGRFEEEGWRIRKDGSRFWANVIITTLQDSAGNLRGFCKITRDITERQELEARYHGLLEAAPDAMVIVNQRGAIVLLNVQAEKQFGYRRDELVGQKVKNIIPEGFAERLIADATRTAADALAQQIGTGIELQGRRKDGSEFPIEIMLSPLQVPEGVLVTAAIRDITQRKKSEDRFIELSHSAQHDALTNLPNRSLLDDRLTQAIAFAQRQNSQFAVLFVDLDHFKAINDALGHEIGDKLLQSVAGRLVASVRRSDTVSRQGGDEFVVVLSHVEQAEDAAFGARKILDALAAPHQVDNTNLSVNVSIGVSTYPGDGQDALSLIKSADTAMYDAKERGRNNYQFFRPEMHARVLERQSLQGSLRHALGRHEFLLHYQPKISLESGEIIGVEALIRWMHPDRGLVPPSQFVPIAEECGLILPIGQWVLLEACRQARVWRDLGLRAVPVAVNVSAVEFLAKDFLSGVRAALIATGVEPRNLELELTESVLIIDAESTIDTLHALKAIGVQLAVDDFGTGYSSFSYLRRFPLDALKIDRSFVRDITVDPNDATIVSAMIGIGKSLRQRVIAEGVETREQLDFLQSQGCGEGQGYYFSRPVVAEQFAELLESGIGQTVVH